MPVGWSAQQWVDQNHPNGFEQPTVCVINGQATLRKDWALPTGPGDVVAFVTVYGDPITLTVIIAVVAIAVALAFALTASATPGSDLQSEPVYSLRGQQNEIRLGEPVECCYGRIRIYPSVAARTWYQYVNNEQYQFSLLCLGQGSFQVDTIQIGDTEISNFQDVEYQVVAPGEDVTLFPTAVHTSTEVGTVEVYAPNEEEYPVDGWIGPYTVNPAGTVATAIEVDFVFPKGFYWMKQSGSVRYLQLAYVVEIREIDDGGSPVGAWTQIFDVDVQWAVTSPKRITLIHDLESAVGRYEIRVKRTSEYLPDHSRVGGQMIWEGLRAHLDEEQNWGDVTLLAVKARASSNLNSTSAKQFNVIATRKLPIWDSGSETWSLPSPTRSIVWAFCDVLRSAYGGRISEDSYLDLDALETLDQFFEATDRDEHFDWIFRDPITVWEALQVIARVGRSVPIVRGSQVTMIRNGPLSVPVSAFTTDNMLPGSFRWDLQLWEDDEYDSVRVEYTDPDTGYKQETVVATLPGGTTDHPEDLRIPGIQNRDHAYREGLFVAARRRYIRENISFETGLEGNIPTYGDLIYVSHDVPRWLQRGYVVDAEYQTNGQWLVTLSEDLEWSESSGHVMYLRASDGSVLGPADVEEVAGSPNMALLDQPETVMDFPLDGTQEPMLFIFGVPGDEVKAVRVVRVEPGDGESVRILGEPELAIVHEVEDDSASVPDAIQTTSYPSTPPDLPEISILTVTQLDEVLYALQVAWPAAIGANYYLVQSSEDGINWVERASTTQVSVVIQARPGNYWVRVAAVGNGQGAWTEQSLVVTSLSHLDVDVPWDDLELGVRWWAVLGAAGYRVSVYDNTVESAPVLVRTEDLEPGVLFYGYGYSEALVDGVVVRELLIEVDALFEDPDNPATLEVTGYPVEQAFSNDMPDAPTGLTQESAFEETDGTVYYTLSWTNPVCADLVRVKVWLSDTPGFDPEVEAPVVDETASAIGSEYVAESAVVAWALDSAGEHPTLYWRVAVFDVWGNEILEESSGGNLSPEETIAAYA